MPEEIKDFDTKYSYKLILKFTSYLDWLRTKGKYQEILYINSRSAPNHEMERVWIHELFYCNKKRF